MALTKLSTTMIEDSAITAAKIADGTVVAAEIADNAITTAKIADATVEAADIIDDAVTTAKIADNAVTTAKINADAITAAKIGDDIINSEHLVDGGVDNAHLATGVTSSKLTGNLPAISGASLTNLPSLFTKSTNDPTITTNPSGGVGTLWLRTSTGEMYCCTDATSNANVWVNIGSGSGNIS